MRKAPLLVLTPGDPAGIGPEITWKAIRSGVERKCGIRVLCIGAEEPFRVMRVPLRIVRESELANDLDKLAASKGSIALLPAPAKATPENKGPAFSLPGFQSGWSIERSVRLVQEGTATALVTGPISKERFQAGGFSFPGHTEFLAELCRQPGRAAPHVVMMLANERLRVSLVTTHLSLADVPRALSQALVEKTIRITADHLQRWWKIRRPRIAVTSLNPHAGEAGLFGKEEQTILSPVIARLTASAQNKFSVSGPHPADTFFAKHLLAEKKKRNDAVISMYHDQGLIPVKMIDFGGTVNITLGLPIIRTSVDHGVGFDIAGKGLADPSSMLAAIKLAALFSKPGTKGKS